MKLVAIDERAWLQLPGYRKNVLVTGDDLHSAGTHVQLVTISPRETIPKHYALPHNKCY